MLLYKVAEVKITPQWGSLLSGSGVGAERAIDQSKRAVPSHALGAPSASGLAATSRYNAAFSNPTGQEASVRSSCSSKRPYTNDSFTSGLVNTDTPPKRCRCAVETFL